MKKDYSWRFVEYRGDRCFHTNIAEPNLNFEAVGRFS
jgi:hypothetical protein